MQGYPIFTAIIKNYSMKKITTAILFFVICSLGSFAQSEFTTYATMDANDALAFQSQFPGEIEILATGNGQAAVFLTEEAQHKVHENVRTHGPGYIFKASSEKAISALAPVSARGITIDYSITEDVLVRECLDLVNSANIENDILDLQDYGTRYHTKAQAEDAVLGQQDKWDAMIAASGRTDVHTRLYYHVNTPMPSVILTIDGADNPSEFVIIGGHIDSTSWNKNDAPGADDNASGISSLNEMVRVLLEKQFVPNRTIEVMAFAAEEIGLVGSGEIAAEYAANGVNVAAYVQFDMTGYKGSAEDIYITTDSYNSTELNNYLVQLMEHYNNAGDHQFSYGFTECGYGCSDHASWATNGYKASFPFEAAMGEDNSNIHTPFDTYSYFNTPEHAARFAKLGLEFLIEAAKPQTLSNEDFSAGAASIFVKEKVLNVRLKNTASPLEKFTVLNIAGQRVLSGTLDGETGAVNLHRFSNGFYIVKLTLRNKRTITKKFVLY